MPSPLTPPQPVPSSAAGPAPALATEPASPPPVRPDAPDPTSGTVPAPSGRSPGSPAGHVRHTDRYRGLWLPLVTPFMSDGAVDHPALRALVADAVHAGIAGFVACGSTGEAAMLSPDEQAEVLATTLAASAGRPVLMGLQGVSPGAVAERANALTAAYPGVAGFLLAPPPYVKPSQAGLLDFYRHVADQVTRPLVVYDIPGRTGVRIAPATLLALADHPRIEAVKDCSGDRAAAETVLADGRLAWLSGNDDELFDQLARGAAGAIVASAHVATRAFVALHEHLAVGELARARADWRRLYPLTRALFAEPNPAPIKGVLARQGRLAEVMRAPMRPAGDEAVAAAMAALDAMDGWES